MEVTNAEKIILLSALALDITETNNHATEHPHSQVIQDVAKRRLEILASLTSKVIASVPTTGLTPEMTARNAALDEAAAICDGEGRYLGPYDDGEDDYEARSMAKSLATRIRMLKIAVPAKEHSVEVTAGRA